MVERERGPLDSATERQTMRWLVSRGLPVRDAAALPALLRDGVLLGDLLKGLDPELDLTGFNRRVLSRTPALANLEIVLGAVWRKSALGKSMPSAGEIYDQRRERIFSLLRVIMEVYVLRAMRRRNRDFLHWMRRVLVPYAMVVPADVSDADLDSSVGAAALWRFLSDGVALFAMAHSCWPASLRPAPHASSLCYAPQSKQDAESNLQIALGCFNELNVPVFVSACEFGARPADHILLLQVHSIFNALQSRHGQHAGLAAPALRDLRFKDHERLLQRLSHLTSTQQLQAEALLHKKSALEAECRALLEVRYQRAMEAVKYELLVRRHERREALESSVGLSRSFVSDAEVHDDPLTQVLEHDLSIQGAGVFTEND